MAQAFHKVIVVGAGPVGLLLAYMLAKRNIEVVVLEADKELNKQPRHEHPLCYINSTSC